MTLFSELLLPNPAGQSKLSIKIAYNQNNEDCAHGEVGEEVEEDSDLYQLLLRGEDRQSDTHTHTHTHTNTHTHTYTHKDIEASSGLCHAPNPCLTFFYYGDK